MYALMRHNRRVGTHTHVQSLRTKMEDQKQHHEDEMKALKDQLKAARNLPIAQLNGDNKSAHAQISKVFLFTYFVLHVYVGM